MKEEQKVAVIGGGVSGLAAAWHLHENTPHQVDLFESEASLGGHAHTTKVRTSNSNHDIDVDVGFMVFNDTNYPNMVEWFKSLGVTAENSDMSLSVSLDQGKTVEWSSNSLFAKSSQIASPAFYQFFFEMLRFNQQAASILLLDDKDPRKHVTTLQYLRQNNYSSSFCTYYLLPMMAALWSASMEDVLQFPAAQLIGFLCNHKMLQLFQRPQWKTVAGRSQQYTNKLASIFGESAHVSTPITKVVHEKDQYTLYTENDRCVGTYDQVVFACHPPTARQILLNGGSTSMVVLRLLQQIEYADNIVYVHSDPKLMPQRKAAWASWNCLGKSKYLNVSSNNVKKGEAFEGGESGFGNKGNEKHVRFQGLEGEQGRMKAVYVTYWLNKLQNLDCPDDIFVSLNPHQAPVASQTHKQLNWSHPQFTPQTLQARQSLKEMNGQDGLWFCGAWQGYGFHEDGCRSGFETATALSGVPLPWTNRAIPVLPPPDLSLIKSQTTLWGSMQRKIFHDIPVSLCKAFVIHFLRQAIQYGRLIVKCNDGSEITFGDGTLCGCDAQPVVLRVFDPWFFVKVATEYDLGLARSYMSGHFNIEPLDSTEKYHPVIKPRDSRDEANVVLGDPIGLTRLFLLIIGNRDHPSNFLPRRAGKGHKYANALTNASGLLVSKVGSFLNYLYYKIRMDNSERGGSLKNIHAHYDLSNDLFRTFLDRETLMYSSAIYDAVTAPSPYSGLVFRGTLEQAQWRKLDTLLDRAQVKPGQTLLDIGFGWGGLSLHAAQKYGCQVTGITLSVEQKALAEERVAKMGLQDLITFEVIDYRTFARKPDNRGKFDRVLSCEMIEAVGHKYLGDFFWGVEQVLKPDGILVMEAITTPEQRYETYLRSTDFINTIIFPGSCCPSLHALVDAAYKNSCLTLEHIDNIGLHYAETLAEWRRRFNARETYVRSLGFDDIFLRVWNYYLTYCEAGFFSQTENCLILVFSRQGCSALAPLCETRSVTQSTRFSDKEIQEWLEEESY